MERFLLLVIVVSSRLPPREKEEEHRTSDADAAAAAARMWSCVRAKRRERERQRGLLFLFSVMRCAFALVESFFSFVWSQKKIRNKKGKRGKKYDTNTTKKREHTRLIGNQRIHPLCHTAYLCEKTKFDRTGVRTRDLFNFLDVVGTEKRQCQGSLPLAFYQVS